MHTHCATRVIFLSLFSCNFDDQLSYIILNFFYNFFLGHYVYTEVSGAESGHTAFLRSVWFQPPPAETYDRTSQHYETCKVWHSEASLTSPLTTFMCFDNYFNGLGYFLYHTKRKHLQIYRFMLNLNGLKVMIAESFPWNLTR